MKNYLNRDNPHWETIPNAMSFKAVVQALSLGCLLFYVNQLYHASACLPFWLTKWLCKFRDRISEGRWWTQLWKAAIDAALGLPFSGRRGIQLVIGATIHPCGIIFKSLEWCQKSFRNSYKADIYIKLEA